LTAQKVTLKGSNPNGGLLLYAAKLYGTTANGGYLAHSRLTAAVYREPDGMPPSAAVGRRR
jgi:hypothetical protein